MIAIKSIGWFLKTLIKNLPMFQSIENRLPTAHELAIVKSGVAHYRLQSAIKALAEYNGGNLAEKRRLEIIAFISQINADIAKAKLNLLVTSEIS
ncbi:MAG: hypothetical protein U5L45_00350 [Saprospiraceae bacterium]|nr:hypothetical protein [Saprospiraceae bacterium]